MWLTAMPLAATLALVCQSPGQENPSLEAAGSALATETPKVTPGVPSQSTEVYDRFDLEAIRKQLDALLPKPEEIKPEPFPEIPHSPPPSEGRMFDYPRRIEPPDLLVVEALEALPGRPITGERLVRPDGTISLDFYGDVHVRGLTVKQAKTKIILRLRQFLDDEVLGLLGNDPDTQKPIFIKPEDSDRVSVDITAYNSAVCYVQGEVQAPGRLPWTGNDTVLDVINYAGGLSPKADLTRIMLIRPDRDDQPPRVFTIDFEGLLKGGHSRSNLQLFPGDRLFVDRKPEN